MNSKDQKYEFVFGAGTTMTLEVVSITECVKEVPTKNGTMCRHDVVLKRKSTGETTIAQLLVAPGKPLGIEVGEDQTIKCTRVLPWGQMEIEGANTWESTLETKTMEELQQEHEAYAQILNPAAQDELKRKLEQPPKEYTPPQTTEIHAVKAAGTIAAFAIGFAKDILLKEMEHWPHNRETTDDDIRRMLGHAVIIGDRMYEMITGDLVK